MTARYRITHEIARGGMSVVYEAVQVGTGQPVALKVSLSGIGREGHVARLRREALALGMLAHPGIVRVLDAGDEPGVGAYIALERIRGRTLAGILAARTIPPVDAAAIGASIAQALAFAHRVGIVHRDVKPANVLIEWEPVGGVDRVKVIDFGVAKVTSFEAADQRLTHPGDAVGTIEYMAPEQITRPFEVDARADQFALGALLFEAITGALPFPDRNVLGIAREADAPPPPLVLGRDVPRALEQAIATAMMPAPQDRFPTMRHMRDALLAAVVPRPLSLLSGPGPEGPGPAHAATEIVDGRGRRRHVRVPYITPVRIVSERGITFDGRTEDLSESGLLVVSRELCPDRATVDVRFALPPAGTVVSVPAKSTWVRRGRDRNAVGLEFIALPDVARVAIARYVAVVSGLASP